MKCPSCNAETKSAKFCEYCGSELPKDIPNINITNNYYGNSNDSIESVDVGKCPKCNSNKVKFQREKIGSIGNSQSRKTVLTDTRKSNSVKQNAYRTVGICQNCGYTWDPNATENNATTKSGKGCLWWFLMLCIWPIALSVWFYKTDKVKLEKKWKIAIIAVFWIFVLVFGGASDESQTETSDTTIESTIQNETSENLETDATPNDVSSENTEETTDTEEVVKDKLYVIDTFIEKYNAIASFPMTDAMEIDIHDKEAGYYRTEFRLGAFNDAKAKRCKIGEDIIDIVCTEEMFDGFNIRIYLITDNRDVAVDVFNSIALNVYPDITEAELTEASDEIYEKDYNDGRGLLRDINYYYIDSYGELFMDNVMYAE